MRKTGVLIGLVSSLFSAAAAQTQSEYQQFCIQAFPDHIVARLEHEERYLLGLRDPADHAFTLEFVYEDTKRWRPDQTLTVAFLGGSYDLRQKIAHTATAWSDYGNIQFDFGHDAQAQTFREWTTSDTAYAADIRIGFNQRGYWSIVGNDSRARHIVKPYEASMNLGRFHVNLPTDWRATVIHEFGHALAFHHAHQHPRLGCDREFRWHNELGYIQTTNRWGGYIEDVNGKRPGLYTVLGGPPNEWSKRKVDHNLKQLTNSSAYGTGEFDPKSIMMYAFPEWMFIDSAASRCYNDSRNSDLSPGDIAGIRVAYPEAESEIDELLFTLRTDLLQVVELPDLLQKYRDRFQVMIDSIPRKL